MVSAGHIHNYERFAQDGVTYLVSGGGGAKPHAVERLAGDLHADTLICEMIRLEDYAAASPAQWKTRDRFEISLRP